MSSYQSMANEFKYHAESIVYKVLEEGIVFRPYTHASLPLFHRLQDGEKTDVLNALKISSRVFETVQNQNLSLQCNQTVLRETLKAFEFEIAPEHLQLITNEHLVTIYSVNHLQLFRNFLYFETFSHTLEDLSCRRWYNLFEQPKDQRDAITNTITNFLDHPGREAIQPTIAEYTVKEKYTLENLEVPIKIDWLIPLFRGLDFVATMTLSKNI